MLCVCADIDNAGTVTGNKEEARKRGIAVHRLCEGTYSIFCERMICEQVTVNQEAHYCNSARSRAVCVLWLNKLRNLSVVLTANACAIAVAPESPMRLPTVSVLSHTQQNVGTHSPDPSA